VVGTLFIEIDGAVRRLVVTVRVFLFAGTRRRTVMKSIEYIPYILNTWTSVIMNKILDIHISV
jgi:hypothetical protein